MKAIISTEKSVTVFALEAGADGGLINTSGFAEETLAQVYRSDNPAQQKRQRETVKALRNLLAESVPSINITLLAHGGRSAGTAGVDYDAFDASEECLTALRAKASEVREQQEQRLHEIAAWQEQPSLLPVGKMLSWSSRHEYGALIHQSETAWLVIRSKARWESHDDDSSSILCGCKFSGLPHSHKETEYAELEKAVAAYQPQ